MSDTGVPEGLPHETEGHAGPHRVIGTPPPAQARTLLGDGSDRAGDGALPAQRELPADLPDPARAKRAERLVAGLFLLSMVAGIGFIAAYVGLEVHSVDAVLRSNLALGLSMSVAFLGLAAGATIWVRHLMPNVELTEQRHPLHSDPEDRQAFAETFAEGAEASQFTKRPLLRRTLIAATVPLVAAPVVLLRDLGPLPGTSLRHTVWRKGMRLLTYGANTPIRPGDFSSPGGMITVVPDGYQDNLNALAAATAIIIKFQPGVMVFGKPGQVRGGYVTPNWTVDNIVCYSKICTHVGCPAALYEQTTHHILCPCHQSTFDAPRGAQVLFGPAPRPLPQLPITTDAEGYLVAQGDFHEPVGPSFWERG
ncbi:MAG TPA: Rieske 2Fe-2S domain-containing protein [Streptosporangiaceae bacterium]|nr:Rieske 2Fe-2S domain-containing protein [Streptosporangiaceae bacterium]